MTSYATRTQTSSEQNDLKKLKSKYSSKLTTLKELFADWSDEDLLFVLEEADGILEVAVDRISEGHATQWGEVKTKKAKKEAQQKAKAAAVAAAPSASQTMSYQKPERTYTERPKPTKARAPSTNNYSRKPTATTATTWGYNSSQKTTSSALDTTSGSWASIASTKPAHDSSSDWNITSDSTFTSSNDLRDQSSWDNKENEITETTTSSALLDDSDKPKSWASLLKSQSKPEPVQETESIEQRPQYNDVVEDTWTAKENEPVIDEWSAPVETSNDPWGTNNETGETTEFNSDRLENDDSEKHTRKLAQDSPVVMPSNDASMSSVDVKFGSLNLDDHIAQQPTKEILTDTKVETQSQPPTTVEPTFEQNTTTNPTTSIESNQQSVQQPSKLKKEEPVYTQPQVQQPQQASAPVPAQVQHLNQPQQQSHQLPQPSQQSQQTPLGMDHLTSAYNSYLPNQHLNGMSGFGMNPAGHQPDYSAYGSEAQRAAAMGYYDPSAFNNSPITTNSTAYPSRDKFGQDISASIGTPQGQSSLGQGLHGQQMYPGMPYYPYYYMPNHYNAYQQSMYGQPMMNKSGYPNMYQQSQPQQAAPVSKPSSQPSYNGNGAAAAAASPYGLHSQLYDQSSHGVGYDSQRQLGSYDYQQLQGFLGHQLPGQQAPQQAQTQSQSVDPTKNDISRAGVTSSQPKSQHTSNYFNQQQMFNYQQYPQQQYWNQ